MYRIGVRNILNVIKQDGRDDAHEMGNYRLMNMFVKKIKVNNSLGLKEGFEKEIISFFLSKYPFVRISSSVF